MSAGHDMRAPLELWAGPECTVNRVGERWRDQLAHSGFARRLSDIDRLASLGVRRVRFPLLWERTAPHRDAPPDWSWAQPRVERLQALGVGAIAGLLHHGSGPRHAGLLDAHFPGHLAAYAMAAARQFPHIEDWTPVNEPLTTARFAALYGLWHPHRRDDASFVRALVNQVCGIAQAMAAIRTVNPHARLVQTEDLGLTTTASPALQPQADFDNERRWLSLDLLAGRVGARHPLRRWLLQHGAREDELDALCEAPCLPQRRGHQPLHHQRALPRRPAAPVPARAPRRQRARALRGPGDRARARHPGRRLRAAPARGRRALRPAGGHHRGAPGLHPRGAIALAAPGLAGGTQPAGRARRRRRP